MKLEAQQQGLENISYEAIEHFNQFGKTQEIEHFYHFLKKSNWISEDSGVIDKDSFNSFFDEKCIETVYFLFERLLGKYPPNEILTMFSDIFDTEYIEEKRNQFSDKSVERNSTWERNHAQIANAFYSLTKDSVTLPTVSEIAQKTKLSRTTIYKHLEHLETDEHHKTQKAFYQFGLQSVASIAYQLGVKNTDLKALKLFADIATKQIEKPKQVNYIQINNTKIDVNKFESLPMEQQQQIIQIIEQPKEIDSQPQLFKIPIESFTKMSLEAQDEFMSALYNENE